MGSREEIFTAQSQMEKTRQPEEPAWRQNARLLRPDDNDFDGADYDRERDDNELFDSSGLYALEELVGGLFSQATNPASRWFNLGIGNPDLAKYGPVADWISTVTTILYRSLSPAVSTFYENAPAWFADMAAFGTGFIAQEEWPERQMLIDTAVPLSQMFKDVDAAGRTERVHRRYPLYGRQIRQRWKVPDEKKIQDDKRYTIIHAVYPNPDYRAGALGLDGFRYLSCRVCKEIDGWHPTGGLNELAYHELGWYRRAGKVWARGPGHNTRADNNMLQEIERTNLVGAQLDAEPPLLTQNDTDITGADVMPNSVIAGGMSDTSKPNAQYLERRSRTQLGEAKAEQKRLALSRAFKFGIHQISTRPEMTAFEFNGWQQQELKQMAPNVVNVQGGLAGVIARRFSILSAARQLPPPPKELALAPLGIEFVSPLAKAQKLAEAQSTMQFIGYIDQQIQATGDPRHGFILNRNKAHRLIGDAMLEDPSILNSPEVVEKLNQQFETQQQQKAQLDAAEQGAGIFANVAHAKQAASRADERAGGKQ